MKDVNHQKICFFNTAKTWGGGEKWHFDVALYLSNAGYDVCVVANKNSALAKRLTTTPIPVTLVCIGNYSFLNPFKFYSLRNFFIREKVVVVVLNLPSDLKVGGWAAKIAGVKRIIYRRGSAVPVKNSFFNRFLFKKVLTDVIANSEATKKTLLAKNTHLFPADKIRIIYNGIDFTKEKNSPIQKMYVPVEGEVILGNAGRMVFQKGHELLIDAAAQLKEAGVNFKLLLAGSGPLEEEIKRKVEALGLTKNVIFLGFVTDMRSFMNSIDIFLLSSRWEGFGFVLTEAMAAAKPIVAFDISSNPELVKHGTNGYLATPFDISEFNSYLIKLIQNKDLRDQFGQAGLTMVHDKFSFQRMAHEFLEMIQLEEI